MRGNVKPKKCFPWRERVRYGFDQVAQHLLGTDRLNRWVKSREVRRRQLLERMYARLQSEEPNPKNRLRDGPVERVKNLSLAEFRSRYQKPGIPMVLEGAALASHSKTYYTR